MRLFDKGHLRCAAILAAGVGIGAGIVAGPSAGASPGAATVVTHHYSLAASAFAPDGIHSATSDYLNFWDPAALSNSDSDRCFNAGAAFPDGAVLKSVVFYYTEGSASMLFEFNRQNLLTHKYSDLARGDTPTSSTTKYQATFSNISAAAGTVSNAKYGYGFGVCPNGNTTFSGVIVTYTTTG